MYDICIAGKNEAAVKAVYYILENYPDLKLCILTNKTDDGINSWQPSMLSHAKNRDLPVESQENLYEIPNLLFISIEYDRLIRTGNYKTKRIFNIHHSLLPAYRGMYTAVFPILNNEKKSGVTLHRIDDGIDTGNIIDQQSFPIEEHHTSRDLYMNYLDHSYKIFLKNFDNLLKNNFTEKKQPIHDTSYYSKKSIDFKSILIDLNKTAYEIKKQIQAYSFKEYQHPKVFDKEIYKTEITEERSNKKPGTIETETEEFIIIHSVDYNVILHKNDK